MPGIGDVVYDLEGNLLGVISQILFDQFAVKVKGPCGVSVVNCEDITVSGNKLKVVEDNNTYLQMYKIT